MFIEIAFRAEHKYLQINAYLYFVHSSAAVPILPRSYVTMVLWQCYDSDLFAGWSEAGTIYAGHVAGDTDFDL